MQHPVSYEDQLRDTVFIVEDDPMVSEQLCAALMSANIRAIRFTSAERFLENITDRHSGCLLTDIRLPGMNGLALQEHLAARNSLISTIVMSGYADVGMAVRAMKAGALEVLEKPLRCEQLVRQIKGALKTSREKARQALKIDSSLEKLNLLTDREKEVLGLVRRGRPNKEIASLLKISPRTVEAHRSRLMRKLNVQNMAELFAAIDSQIQTQVDRALAS